MDLERHVLLISDEFTTQKAGVYSVQYGILNLLEKQPTVKITCLSTKNNVEVCLNAQTIYPCTQAFSDHALSLSDLVNRHQELYPDDVLSQKAIGVTHIVIFAYEANEKDVQAGTLDCVKPGGLIDRIKAFNKHNKQEVRVIVLNWLNLHNYRDLLENTNLDDVLNVGINIDKQNEKLINEFKPSGASHLTFPVFPSEFIVEGPSKDSKDNFLVLTFVSHLSPCKNDFLKKCQSGIEKVRQKFQKSQKEIRWEVYYGDGLEMDEIKTDNAEKAFSSFNKNLLRVASLCIVQGDFESDVYSGLELLHNGVPTLFEEGTYTHQNLEEIDGIGGALPKYFCLDLPIETKIEDMLMKEAKTASDAQIISREYRKSLKVRKGLAKLLQVTCGITKHPKDFLEQQTSSPVLPVTDENLTQVKTPYGPMTSTEMETIIPSPTGDILHPSLLPLSLDIDENETQVKSPSTYSQVRGAYQVSNNGQNMLQLQDIRLSLTGDQIQQGFWPPNQDARITLGSIVADGPSGARRKTTGSRIATTSQASPNRGRKDMNSQGDSDHQSSDSEGGATSGAVENLSLVTPVKAKTKKPSSSKSSNSFFSTTKYPKSDYERRMRKIKKETEKPLKEKKKKP